MIRYMNAIDLSLCDELRTSMFEDRAAQFSRRLNWKVDVTESGWEIDRYDELNPLYVIWSKPNGLHGGSVRILPTVGPTMTADYFLHLTNGVRIASPLIWECTRFCLSPGASSDIAPAIILAGIELGIRFGIEQALGVIYSHSLPLYRRLGWSPEILGSEGDGRDQISVCLWDISLESRAIVSRRAGLSEQLVEWWFNHSFDRNDRTAPPAAIKMHSIDGNHLDRIHETNFCALA